MTLPRALAILVAIACMTGCAGGLPSTQQASSLNGNVVQRPNNGSTTLLWNPPDVKLVANGAERTSKLYYSKTMTVGLDNNCNNTVIVQELKFGKIKIENLKWIKFGFLTRTPGPYSCTLVATDSQNPSVTATVTITVKR
ncbi:MAG: hypothetical protein WB615_06925 [Candidatus Tumulicola sp.]